MSRRGDGRVRDVRAPRHDQRFRPLSLYLAGIEIHGASARRHLVVLLAAFGAVVAARIPRSQGEADDDTYPHRRINRRRQGPILPALARDVAARPPRFRDHRHGTGVHRHDAVLRRQLLGAAGAERVRRSAYHRNDPPHFRGGVRNDLHRSPCLCGDADRQELAHLRLVWADVDDPQPRRRPRHFPDVQVVLRPGSEAAVRQVDILGEVRLLGAVLGVAIIGTSGAMLWFKEFTASILPGWVFNVATIFHGEEAFLAVGFLFSVHFFNNHWRPENFPLDIMMFTGSMPLGKVQASYSIEYDRLVRTGQLDKYLVEAPSPPMKLGSQIFGFALMASGLILLILILSGFVRSMIGWLTNRSSSLQHIVPAIIMLAVGLIGCSKNNEGHSSIGETARRGRRRGQNDRRAAMPAVSRP